MVQHNDGINRVTQPHLDPDQSTLQHHFSYIHTLSLVLVENINIASRGAVRHQNAGLSGKAIFFSSVLAQPRPYACSHVHYYFSRKSKSTCSRLIRPALLAYRLLRLSMQSPHRFGLVSVGAASKDPEGIRPALGMQITRSFSQAAVDHGSLRMTYVAKLSRSQTIHYRLAPVIYPPKTSCNTDVLYIMPAVSSLAHATFNRASPNETVYQDLVPKRATALVQLKAQWTNPSDILSFLLLLGPDVIQRALAQVVGRRITPVAFSFGWVAYAVNSLLSTVGGMRV